MPPVRERMDVVDGDITSLKVDAIVNAANDRLAPGGGVCGAIFRAAGPQLDVACAALDGCPTGEARITPGFDLPARWIVHAVGPVWHGGGQGEPGLLAGCYRHSLEIAASRGCRSVAFPAISTGIYGYPPADAAPLAAATVAAFLRSDTSLDRVIFCCFGAESAKLHRDALADLPA